MADSSCFQSYRAAVGGLTTAAACDHLVQSAFVDYVRGRLSDVEYSTIYFSANSHLRVIRAAKELACRSAVRITQRMKKKQYED